LHSSGKKGPDLLVFSREASLIGQIRKLFQDDNLQLSFIHSQSGLLEIVECHPVKLLVIDATQIRRTANRTIGFLRKLRECNPRVQIILLIREQAFSLLRSVLETGSFQYAKLPIQDGELRVLIETALHRSKRDLPHSESDQAECIPGFVGNAFQIKQAYRLIARAARQDVSVLLLGETGTGKDLAASAIHRMSPRNTGPFVPVNLGAFPTDLVASELFGHEKGAFTGASQQVAGRFEQAQFGTIFLDEIDSIDEKVQIALLRLLEHKSYHRIGGKENIRSDCRIIAASNVSFDDLLHRGSFRNDLLFRLDVFRIQLPPLRDCPDDIPLLARYFLEKFSLELGKSVRTISEECMDILTGYDWPGNVRELKNVIQRAVLVCDDITMIPMDLPDRFQPIKNHRSTLLKIGMGATLHEIERKVIKKALELANNNRTETAKLLGITRPSLYNKLEKHGLK